MIVLTGTAIYPTLALLNHSCDPNITKYFDGKKVIVVAGKKIFKGINILIALKMMFAYFNMIVAQVTYFNSSLFNIL